MINQYSKTRGGVNSVFDVNKGFSGRATTGPIFALKEMIKESGFRVKKNGGKPAFWRNL
jgi:hypothetical protein